MEAQQDRLNSPPVSEIMKKIDHMENELRMVKQSVISNLEKQIQDLKSSLVNAISKAMPQQTYASAVQTQSQSSERNSTLQKDNKIGPHNHVNTGMKRRDDSNICHDHSKRGDEHVASQSTDEGFCNFSNSVLGSSQTFVKTTYPMERHDMTQSAGQPVPVLITNRNSESASNAQDSVETAQQRKQTDAFPSSTSNRTTNGKILLIGDSILNNVNTKGLVKDVQKHAKGGARVNDIIDSISVYDMRNFETCIIYVGGNDCAKKTNVESFVEAYDQLISIIKSSNHQCKIYICDIAPRGDTDVSDFNRGIERLSKHWDHQPVYHISNTNSYFFDKKLLPLNRYFNADGIHLSHSGVKRLLDAINGSVRIVVDYALCVFSNAKMQKRNGSRDKPTGHSRGYNGPQSSGRPYQSGGRPYQSGGRPYQSYMPTGGAGRRSRYGNSRKQCFGCNMVGHILAECWNVR